MQRELFCHLPELLQLPEGSHVLGLSVRLAAEKQSTVSLGGPHDGRASTAALAANETLPAGPPLLLYCNVTSPCTACAPSIDCTAFRCACFPARPFAGCAAD